MGNQRDRTAFEILLGYPVEQSGPPEIDAVLHEWLSKKNGEYEELGLSAKARMGRALTDYSTEFKVSIDIGSGVFQAIHYWFEVRSRPGTHHVGSLLVGVLYFNGSFWRVSISVSWGTISVDPFSAFDSEMSELVLAELHDSDERVAEYLLVWADLADWAYAHDELARREDSVGSLVKAANNDLESAASTLLSNQPRKAADEDCRMAAEKAMKALLRCKSEVTENELRFEYGHNLAKLAAKASEFAKHPDFGQAKQELKGLRNIGDRYDGDGISDGELWRTYRLCIGVCAAVARELTDHDVRRSVVDQLGRD